MSRLFTSAIDKNQSQTKEHDRTPWAFTSCSPGSFTAQIYSSFIVILHLKTEPAFLARDQCSPIKPMLSKAWYLKFNAFCSCHFKILENVSFVLVFNKWKLTEQWSMGVRVLVWADGKESTWILGSCAVLPLNTSLGRVLGCYSSSTSPTSAQFPWPTLALDHCYQPSFSHSNYITPMSGKAYILHPCLTLEAAWAQVQAGLVLSCSPHHVSDLIMTVAVLVLASSSVAGD